MTSKSLANSGSSARWLRWATQVVSAASLGKATMPSIGQGWIVGQRPQLRIDDADPVDRTLGVDVHPEVLQAGVPGATLEHEQRHDASDDDVGQRGGQLLGHRRPAVGLLGGDLEHRLQAIGGRPPRRSGHHRRRDRSPITATP